MSLPVPLTVRLSTSAKDSAVTRQLRDLWFREVAVGGWASARLALDRPLTVNPDEIKRYGKVFVHDGRSGATVWEGRLADPGRGAGSDGTVWQIAAEGPAAHAQDRTIPLIYVDSNLNNWALSRFSNRSDARVNIDEEAFGAPGWRMHIPRGAVVGVNGRAEVYHRLLADTDQSLARLQTVWDAGVTDTNWRISLRGSTDGTSTGLLVDVGASTAGGTLSASMSGTIPADQKFAYLRLERQTAGITVADDVTWAHLASVVMRGTLKAADGNDITTGYSLNTVLTHEIIADLLGRLLTDYDGAGATIATTTHPIDQLAYPDGTTAARLLEDLLEFEPGFRWGAYESNTAGKHRFEFVPWPTTVRYQADVRGGFDSPGSGAGLFDAVRVRWRDTNGDIRTTRRTSTVAELSNAGLTREGFLDLGDEVGSSANATRAGDQFLAEHATAPNAGRLTLSDPVMDLVTGRTVMPWEIKAGELIRVRGVLPRADVLNATARDGVTVFRIWAKEYSAVNAAATLELDSYPVTVGHALAALARRPAVRRR